MLNHGDLQFLLRAIRRNRCVLFLGAGFSADAVNRRGEKIPAGSTLARKLWAWLGYGAEEEYDFSGLDRLFDVARRTRGDAAVKELLRDQLLVQAYPDWYKAVAKPFWHRIYTTNADNLIERIYSDVGPIKIQPINGVIERYRDRPAFLEHLQYIKLNGTLDDSLDLMTFGARQYARRSSDYDPWYDHFVRDYSTHATILVGTQLNEPLFLQALEARQGREGAASELRLKSFLVSDRISPVIADSLRNFNVVPVEARAEDFFGMLDAALAPHSSRDELLQEIRPDLASHMYLRVDDRKAYESMEAFFQAFERVEVIEPPAQHRSLFLLGAAATWDDIALGLDARRQVTADVQQAIENQFDAEEVAPIVVAGHRGAGKSTLMMRAAVNLSAAGYLVYFASGEDLPEPHMIARALDKLDQDVILFIDDGEWNIGRVADLAEAIGDLNHLPSLIVALRGNTVHILRERQVEVDEMWLPDLTDADIDAVIDILERENRLGVMTGKPRNEIRAAFKIRAHKQLLVAMREVTAGKDFDKIIEKELLDVTDPELRVAYVVACLATAEAASLSRDQLLAITKLPPARMLSALERELNQLLVPIAGPRDRLAARHPVIAQTVIEKVSKGVLADAYKRLLGVLAHDMDAKARRGEGRRWFRLYKRIVNHTTIYRRFENNLEEARQIYESLAPRLSKDAHFWLQFGSLELEYGEVRFARHYLASAEGLEPDSHLVRNAKGHLLLLEGRLAGTRDEAVTLRNEAKAILNDLIEEWTDNPYPWHTLISHDLDWLRIWEPDAERRRAEIEPLREMISEACEAHPRSDELLVLQQRVEREYLLTAVDDR